MNKLLYCLLGVALAVIATPLVHRVSAQSSPETRILVPFITGTDAGYESLLLVNNPTVDPYGIPPSSGTCEVAAEPYSGGSLLTGTLGTIPAGQSMVFTEAQIGTATGLTLANSGQRAYLYLTCNFPFAQAQMLFVNPGGVVTFDPGIIISSNLSSVTVPEPPPPTEPPLPPPMRR